ncbi:VOC family protein, partial [Gordonia terrae]
VAAPRPPADPVPSSPVTLWGVAWRSIDVDATHARLTAAGLDLSEIRVGRKKGTRIFTVRHRELATRTVVIGPEA